MCAITASFSKEKLLKLYKQNAYRGELSHSLTNFEYDDEQNLRIGVLFKDDGPLDIEVLDSIYERPGRYFVTHSQAPTTDTSYIHPAEYHLNLLWHNGIVKQKNLKEGTWDTYWLLKNIINEGWDFLSSVDGTFACIMYRDYNLYVFRNEISPLFFDNDLNLSSTKFEGSRPVTPNKVWRVNLDMRCFEEAANFTTYENPYYMPESV